MRVLFLDDMDSRWNEFFQRLKAPDIELLRATTADEAVKLLDEIDEWDYVFLDHDLDEEHYTGYFGGSSPTGMAVVQYIVRHAYAFHGTKFIVHSLNPDGSARMTDALRDAGLIVQKIPGAWTKVSFR